MAHWTSQYFGKLYHQIYSTHLLEPQRALDEAAFAAHVLDLGRRTVLDLACGYGRHARLLASSNRVIALDNSRHYLAEMQVDLSDRLSQNLSPLCADMRQIPLADKAVDAAVMLFNSFGYFDAGDDIETVTANKASSGQVWKLPNVFYERQLVDPTFGKFRDTPEQVSPPKPDSPELAEETENLLVLREVLRVLKPGGGFLLEVPNPRPLLEAVQENPRRLMVMEDSEVHEEFEWDQARKRLVNKTRFVVGENHESAAYSMRLYEPAEVKALLKQTGFIVRRMYGDYEGGKFFPSTSDIILFHATRPARSPKA